MGSLLSEGAVVINQGTTIGGELPAILEGILVAGISGYLAIRVFLRLIGKASLNGFAVYMMILGIAVMHCS